MCEALETKIMKVAILLVMLLLICVGFAIAESSDVDLTVYMDRPSHAISPMLYGLFFEDINFAADGGLYAELIQNRSFEFDESLFNWTITSGKSDSVETSVLDNDSLNKNNPHYLRLSIDDDASSVKIENSGFGGIVIEKGQRYLFSFYARTTDAFDRTLTFRLESSNGVSLGQSNVRVTRSSEWSRYTGTIKAKGDDIKSRLVLQAKGKGTVDLDMISLFPENTWKKQPNGLREDLVEILHDLKPAFFRFPGGCIVEGHDLTNAYQWKDSIGELAQRKMNWNRWRSWKKPPQYYQSLGLGFFEFFRLSEDIGAEPLPILNCGMSCQYEAAELVPMDELGPYVQDALDLIEYANGSKDSLWGSKRAKAGHPKPFNLKYLGVGNEQWDEGYFDRYDIFYKAIKAKYPEIQIITTSGPGSDGKWFDLAWKKFKEGTPAELVDEHYYRSPEWFLQNDTRYDSYDRNGPKVFAGEYAAHGEGKRNTLYTALAEAAFITGLERNSDVVTMAAYAPLLAKVGSTQWTPDLIFFDNTKVCGTPSYYVQKMFSENKGSVYLKNEIKDLAQFEAKPAGRIALCTWRTSAEFKDVKVTCSDKELLSSSKTSDWKNVKGKWSFENGICTQSDAGIEGAICFIGDTKWSDYTFSLKARKTAGREGFIIGFRRNDNDDGLQWNLGGWGNTKHVIQSIGGGAANILTEVPGSIESDHWYDIQIKLDGDKVQCFLDGKLVHELTVPVSSSKRFYASCTRDDETKKVHIKAVNPTSESISLNIHLKGAKKLEPSASVQILTGENREMENTLDRPENISPEILRIDGIANDFKYVLKPYSLSFIEMKEQ